LGGGVKRISGLIYKDTRGVLKIFLKNVIRDAITYIEHPRHKTVTTMNVVYMLGRTLYGFGGSFLPLFWWWSFGSNGVSGGCVVGAKFIPLYSFLHFVMEFLPFEISKIFGS
jgi:hypothetical protein